MFSQTLTVTGLGSGVRSIDHSCLPNSPIEFSQTTQVDKKSSPSSSISMSVIENEDNLYTQLGVEKEVSSQFRVTSEVRISKDAKEAFASQVKFDSQSIYFMVKKQVMHTETLTGTVTLNNDAARLIVSNHAEAFYTYYGDRFVNQITYGTEIFVVLQWKLEGIAQYQKNGSKKTVDTHVLAVELAHALNSQSSMEKFSKMTQAAYWVYISGNKDAKSFVPDTSSVPSFLTSIAKLLQMDPDVTPEIPLSYSTLPYATAVVKSDVTYTVGSETKTAPKTKVTDILLRLQEHIHYLAGLHFNISSLLTVTTEYSGKYEELWKKVCQQPERYKASETLKDIMSNKDSLQEILHELAEIDGDIVTMSSRPTVLLNLDKDAGTEGVKPENGAKSEPESTQDASNVEQSKAGLISVPFLHASDEPFLTVIKRDKAMKQSFVERLTILKNKLSELIDAFPAIESYQYLQTIKLPQGSKHSKSFTLNIGSDVTSLFWRSQSSGDDPKNSWQFNIERKVSQSCSSRFFCKEVDPDIYGYSISAKGTYTDAVDLASGGKFILQGNGTDKPLDIEVFAVRDRSIILRK